MQELTIVQPDTTEIEAQGYGIVDAANTFSIVDSPTYEEAGVFSRLRKTRRNAIVALFKEPVDHAFKAHRAMTKMRNDLDMPEKIALGIINQKMINYTNEQERIRRAEEQRLREIAQQEAEDRQLAEAERLEKAGEVEAAEQVIEAPPVVHVPIVESEVPKIKGVSMRTTWKARVINVAAVPREWMIPNQQSLDAFARSTKGNSTIPGVEFDEVQTVASSAY